jgi:hypothetical protein
MLGRRDTPWYPSMRLFRQTERRNWDSVFAEISSEVAALVQAKTKVAPSGGYSAGATRPVAPISWGELIDKITILEIKMQRLTNSQARKNVQYEHTMLAKLIGAIDVEPPGLDSLMSELRIINVALWDVEDAIRLKEARTEFDDEFVKLARAVYSTNDRRAEVKRRINELLSSDLMEEKQHPRY